MTAFTDRLVQVSRAELQRWSGGTETQSPWRRYVKEYWESIDINNLDGATVQDGKRPAWSSAFVSFCVRKAGAGNRFEYTQAHCHYIKKSMDKADGTGNHGYIARKYESYKPKVGDIICGGREYAKSYTYEQAKLIYIADSFYPSHGDIVVGIAADGSYVETIGGNVSNDVSRKRLRLKSSGKLEKRVSGGIEYPWVAVLECIL